MPIGPAWETSRLIRRDLIIPARAAVNQVLNRIGLTRHPRSLAFESPSASRGANAGRV